MERLCEKGPCEKPDLQSALLELVKSIDAKWDGETPRRRQAALSPRIEDALANAKGLLGMSATIRVYGEPVE